MNLLTRSLLVTGQLSCFETLLMSFSLSLRSMVQSYIRWSTVWFLPSQGHIYIYIYTHTHIQGVPGGKDLTSGECSLGQTIPI